MSTTFSDSGGPNAKTADRISAQEALFYACGKDCRPVCDLARPHAREFENALEHALAGVVEDDLPAVRAFTPDQREDAVVFLGFALGGSF